MYDIAGTSTSNVFTVGHNSSSAAGSMFRFDGKRWRTTGFSREEGGPISGSLDLFSVLAFSASDIWFAGALFPQNPNPPPITIDSSLLVHYDGMNWQEYNVSGARLLEAIHGISPNDIWACGYYGTVLHYNGFQWKRDSIQFPVPDGAFFALRHIRAVSPSIVYALGQVQKLGQFTVFYIFQRSGGNWEVIDSTVDGSESFGKSDLWVSPSGILYTTGGLGVYRRDSTQWKKIFSAAEPLRRIWGYNDNNIFVGGHRTLLHYNGTDFYQYPNANGDMVYSGMWGDGKELFVAGNDGNKSYIFHGK